VSFLNEVAPILVQKCLACHNARKAESKYDLSTFNRLARGGRQGAGLTLEPGHPERSGLIELIQPEGEPRMPYKLEPLAASTVALLERWVQEGAHYDGDDPDEDWAALLRRRTPIVVPERYPTTVPIAALAFSPDGSALATSGNHEVNLWPTRNRGAVPNHRLRGTAERIHDIVYSPDGRWLAIASGDPGRSGLVTLWSATPDGTASAGRELFKGGDSVFAATFSPDGTRLAAAGSDRTVRVWNVETGQLLSTIEDHADWILGLAFSPNGQFLATASRDRTSKVFDWAKRSTLATFAGHADTVHAVSFTPEGGRVATGGGDGLVRIWTPADDAKQETSLGGFKGPVFRLRFGPDGKDLVACSADRTISVFKGKERRLTLTGHTDWIHALAISPDGQTLASGSWDGEIRLWRLADGQSTGTFLAAPGLSSIAGTPR
jgi:WD40 repeat protein